MQDALVALYTRTFGRAPASVVRLAADGSQRLYFRLGGEAPASVIGAYGPDPDENRAFLSFSRSFRAAGLPVPEIFAADESRRIWLEEDLGDTTLFQAVSGGARARTPGAFPPAVEAAYERVLDVLPRFQVEGARVVDFALAYPRAAFDGQSMLWDLNYFKYHFLKLAHVPFNEQRLEDDFHRLIAHLLTADTGYFLYRDFQSRNILLREGEPWFVDYQGGRRGAAQYDVASLLYDAKADIPEAARARLLARYLGTFARLTGTQPAALPRDLPRPRAHPHHAGDGRLRLPRLLRAQGPLPRERPVRGAQRGAACSRPGCRCELPELEGVFRHVVAEWAERESPIAPPQGLNVHVASFSYRDGWPPDESGHGGGHVFDCRWLPNPGRLQELSGLTGRDAPIVRFLEAIPETELFWGHVVALVEAHIANFRERNFSDLSVAFGCTGGQHRSVYFAERMARHVRERHAGVAVHLRHAARERWALRESAAAPAPGGRPVEGMIFAAGLGTRLGALGESTPKALIEVGGRTLLEHTVRALRSAGARRIVVNAHHHADAIERFVAGHDFGVEVLVSREDDRPLETGGGLLHARGLFHEGESILMHNVDVLSTFHLCPLVAQQDWGEPLANLVVQERDTARQLLFDETGLFGREDRRRRHAAGGAAAAGRGARAGVQRHPRLLPAPARPHHRARGLPHRGRLPAARRPRGT